MTLKSPFPYFGAKSKIADEVWSRFGPVQNYVEPFFGSGAVLLSRPAPFTTETVNDKDLFIANFWRALKHAPNKLAEACDWPINECDLEARHLWLVNEGADRLLKCKSNPTYYDLKTAAWWVWGLSQWIGYGWCRGYRKDRVWKKIPVADSRKGVHRRALHPFKQKPQLSSKMGINTYNKMPRIGGWGDMGIRSIPDLRQYFQQVHDRLRLVRVCCGDWKRVTVKSTTSLIGTTAVFLDPPYTASAGRTKRLYNHDSESIGHQVAAWAFENGKNSKMRIALCGYEGEYKIPEGWKTHAWKALGGHSNQAGPDSAGSKNRIKERVWFSPYCIEPQPELF